MAYLRHTTCAGKGVVMQNNVQVVERYFEGETETGVERHNFASLPLANLHVSQRVKELVCWQGHSLELGSTPHSVTIISRTQHGRLEISIVMRETVEKMADAGYAGAERLLATFE